MEEVTKRSADLEALQRQLEAAAAKDRDLIQDLNGKLASNNLEKDQSAQALLEKLAQAEQEKDTVSVALQARVSDLQKEKLEMEKSFLLAIQAKDKKLDELSDTNQSSSLEISQLQQTLQKYEEQQK